MNDRFLFNAVVSSYYDIDTPENYEEFEPQIYLENVDLFSDEIGIDYDRLLDAVQRQLKLEKPEISQVMQYFEDNSLSNSEEYVTIKPDKVLQCTGLKDKNSKLIYEGDVVRYAEYEIEDIKPEWKHTEIVWGGNHDYPAFDLKSHDFDCNGLSYIFNEGWTIEVIGNIYETPANVKGVQK